MVSDTRKYQVTIPKRVREKLDIKAGDDVIFLKTKDGYRIIRADEIIEEGFRIFEDITETVKEIKAGLGKGLIE
jgi:looped-hinge helix DNA binding domain, AbrB family